jgi:hypothetical protein
VRRSSGWLKKVVSAVRRAANASANSMKQAQGMANYG